jgi:hypothetical protein
MPKLSRTFAIAQASPSEHELGIAQSKLVVIKNINIYVGFYKDDYYLVSPTVQFDLRTMERLSMNECILVSDIKPDSISFAMK